MVVRSQFLSLLRTENERSASALAIKLDFSNQKMNILEEFTDLNSLIEIDLSSNYLNELNSSTFLFLPNIEILNVSFNFLKSIQLN